MKKSLLILSILLSILIVGCGSDEETPTETDDKMTTSTGDMKTDNMDNQPVVEEPEEVVEEPVVEPPVVEPPMREYFIGSLTGHANNIYSVAFSPEGDLLASGSYDHTARLWDTSDGTEVHALTGHTDLVRCVAFSPDGTIPPVLTRLPDCGTRATVQRSAVSLDIQVGSVM